MKKDSRKFDHLAYQTRFARREAKSTWLIGATQASPSSRDGLSFESHAVVEIESKMYDDH